MVEGFGFCFNGFSFREVQRCHIYFDSTKKVLDQIQNHQSRYAALPRLIHTKLVHTCSVKLHDH